jgi:hypothetical protein
MEVTVSVDIDVLMELTKRLLLSIKNQGHSSVMIPDKYWDIPSPERYNVGVTPGNAAKHLDTPSLELHWQSVQDMASGKEADPALALEMVGPLLRAIGEQFPKKK